MREHIHRFKSVHAANERTIWIREPADPAKPCSLAIFLDGELYRDWVHANSIIDELNAASAITNTLVVFVSHESMEARWRECPCYPPFADFINLELLPWIEKLHPQTKEGRERILIGLSYTGLAAAFIALRAPEKYALVIAQSGSFWSDNLALVKQYRDTPTLHPTAFYLDVGLKETATNVRHKEDVLQVVSQIVGVKAFRDVLKARNIEVRYIEFDGGHECAAWKITLPDALQWALPRTEAT
jgi:enterochelin esterase family protein